MPAILGYMRPQPDPFFPLSNVFIDLNHPAFWLRAAQSQAVGLAFAPAVQVIERQDMR